MGFFDDWMERKRKRREQKRKEALFAAGGLIPDPFKTTVSRPVTSSSFPVHSMSPFSTGVVSPFGAALLNSSLSSPFSAAKQRFSGMQGFSETGDWDFAAGSVKGYREWHLKFDRDVLTGEWRPGPWLIGHWGGEWQGGAWHKATCQVSALNTMSRLYGYGFINPHTQDEVPYDVCGCGFWAYWKGNEARAFTDAFIPFFQEVSFWDEEPNYGWCKFTVRGVGEGAGRTIIGEKGFRSQKMRIKAVAFPDYPIDQVRRVFGKDVHPDVIIDMVREKVAGLLPEVPLLYDTDKLKEYM